MKQSFGIGKGAGLSKLVGSLPQEEKGGKDLLEGM